MRDPAPQFAAGIQENPNPIHMLELRVLPHWIDYNNHMTEHRYLQVFGETTDAFLRYVGLDDNYLETGHSYYTIETHIIYIDSLIVNQRAHTTTQIMNADAKRIHLFHRLHTSNTSAIVATAEHMLLHVDTTSNRCCPAAEAILGRLLPLTSQHAKLDIPNLAGRYVGQPKPR